MAEDDGEEIAGVFGLPLFIAGEDVELGDLDRLAELGEAIENADHGLGRRDGVAEMALHADDVGPLPLFVEVADPLGVVVLLGFRYAATGENGVLVDGHPRAGRRVLPRHLEPLRYHVFAQNAGDFRQPPQFVGYVILGELELFGRLGYLHHMVQQTFPQSGRILGQRLDGTGQELPAGIDDAVAARGEVVIGRPLGAGQVSLADRRIGPAPIGPVDRRGAAIEQLQRPVAELVVVWPRAGDRLIFQERAEAVGVPLHLHVNLGPRHRLAIFIDHPHVQVSLAVLLDPCRGLRAPGGVGLLTDVTDRRGGQLADVDIRAEVQHGNAADFEFLDLRAQVQRQVVLSRVEVFSGPAVNINPIPLLAGDDLRRSDPGPLGCAALDEGVETTNAVGPFHATGAQYRQDMVSFLQGHGARRGEDLHVPGLGKLGRHVHAKRLLERLARHRNHGNTSLGPRGCQAKGRQLAGVEDGFADRQFLLGAANGPKGHRKN